MKIVLFYPHEVPKKTGIPNVGAKIVTTGNEDIEGPDFSEINLDHNAAAAFRRVTESGDRDLIKAMNAALSSIAYSAYCEGVRWNQ